MPLDKIQPDLILAYDLRDAAGRSLLVKGFRFTKESIVLLKQKNVKSAYIVKEEIMTQEEIKEKREEVKQQLQKRFRKVNADVGMNKLLESLLEYKLKSMGLNTSK
jgi:hypothetical protein